jgi:hypothetical protein
MASFMYYCKNKSVLTDKTFDRLTAILQGLTREEINSHMHGHLITDENLQVGSNFDMEADEYPNMVKHSAMGIKPK